LEGSDTCLPQDSINNIINNYDPLGEGSSGFWLFNEYELKGCAGSPDPSIDPFKSYHQPNIKTSCATNNLKTCPYGYVKEDGNGTTCEAVSEAVSINNTCGLCVPPPLTAQSDSMVDDMTTSNQALSSSATGENARRLNSVHFLPKLLGYAKEMNLAILAWKAHSKLSQWPTLHITREALNHALHMKPYLKNPAHRPGAWSLNQSFSIALKSVRSGQHVHVEKKGGSLHLRSDRFHLSCEKDCLVLKSETPSCHRVWTTTQVQCDSCKNNYYTYECNNTNLLGSGTALHPFFGISLIFPILALANAFI